MHPRRALRALTARDITVVPAVCYVYCNNCYIEAQKVGLSPALCVAGSLFEIMYSKCAACVSANGNSTKVVDFPALTPFLNFCDANALQYSIISSFGAYYTTVTQSIYITVLANTTAPSSPTNSGALESLVPSPQSRNYAWVAGLLVGILLLLAAIGVALFYFRKRRKTKEVPVMEVDPDKKDPEMQDKAQLHADSIIVSRYELDTGIETRSIPELPALEPVGSELQGRWLGTVDRDEPVERSN